MKKILMTTALSASLATAAVADTAMNTTMSAKQLRSDMLVSSQSANPSSTLVIIILMAVLVFVAGISTGSGEGMYYFSDASLKTDIRKVGTSPSGIGIYQFRYIGHPQVFEGVLAQDVLKHRPNAVMQDEHGLYMVDYSQTDVTPRLVR